MNKRKQILKRLIHATLNILFSGCCLLVCYFLVQIFCFTSFKIPSDSMEPALKDGDRILVNKIIKGARLFNVFAALRNERVAIYRMPGLGDINRNDVLVFNFPYQEFRWDSIRMNVMQYYVKRCISLPGDTLEIRGGIYKVRGCNEVLGNRKAQLYLAGLKQPEELGIVVGTFPYNENFGWNIHEFGPLPIPQKGQVVTMTHTNYILYKQLIAWEQNNKIELKDGKVFVGDSLIHQYCFEKNYYFVSGDNMANSQDSRYWGMLPEEYIVGKATRIWCSKDKFEGRMRWERFLKKIK